MPVTRTNMGQLDEDGTYMFWSLALANWRPDGDDLPPYAVNWVWNSLTTDTHRLARPPLPRDLVDDPADLAKIKVDQGALDYGQRVRSALERFMTGNKKDLGALRLAAKLGVEHMHIRPLRLELSADGTLQHVYSYGAHDGAVGARDGPLGLFLAFLLDPERSFGRDLRRCRLKGCERFFFVPAGRRGGPIPAFCPHTDHQRRHDAMSSAKRAKEYRARQAVRAAAKHK